MATRRLWIAETRARACMCVNRRKGVSSAQPLGRSWPQMQTPHGVCSAVPQGDRRPSPLCLAVSNVVSHRWLQDS